MDHRLEPVFVRHGSLFQIFRSSPAWTRFAKQLESRVLLSHYALHGCRASVSVLRRRTRAIFLLSRHYASPLRGGRPVRIAEAEALSPAYLCMVLSIYRKLLECISSASMRRKGRLLAILPCPFLFFPFFFSLLHAAILSYKVKALRSR
jgi:hypothetical protein